MAKLCSPSYGESKLYSRKLYSRKLYSRKLLSRKLLSSVDY